MLAVVWVALMLDRRALLLITACTGLMFALPLTFIGDPAYPSNGWRGAVLFTLVALVVGEVAQRSVTHMRTHAANAQTRSEELEEMQRAFGTMAAVAREIALGTEARELVCTAALASLDATIATVVEPRDAGFAITGSAGVPLDRAEIRRVEPLASLQAFKTRERVFVADAHLDARVSPAIVQATGLISIAYEPILRDGEAVGVLAVGWNFERASLDVKTDTVLRFLAAEAGAAIERADLLAQLDGLARSDPLTGLANRRTWNDVIANALRDETTLCVAMIDIDHFKQFNDEHGHAAGDRLLKACAGAWRSHLRAEDTLARVGGEEFAVLLPRCSITNASGCARAPPPRDAERGDGVRGCRRDPPGRGRERRPRARRPGALRGQDLRPQPAADRRVDPARRGGRGRRSACRRRPRSPRRPRRRSPTGGGETTSRTTAPCPGRARTDRSRCARPGARG